MCLIIISIFSILTYIIAFSGAEHEPRRLSTQIIFASLFASSLIIYAAYGASLTSFLAVFKFDMPFNTIRDLYHETPFTVGSVAGTSFNEIFEVFNFA